MAVKYRVIQRTEPGVVGGGTKKYYAKAVRTGEKNIESLTRSIEKISTVSGADIRAVLYALVDVISEDLANSYVVRIGDLGSMSVTISSHGFDTEEEVGNNAIRGSKITFNPGPALKDMLLTLKYSKEK